MESFHPSFLLQNLEYHMLYLSSCSYTGLWAVKDVNGLCGRPRDNERQGGVRHCRTTKQPMALCEPYLLIKVSHSSLLTYYCGPCIGFNTAVALSKCFARTRWYHRPGAAFNKIARFCTQRCNPWPRVARLEYLDSVQLACLI